MTCLIFAGESLEGLGADRPRRGGSATGSSDPEQSMRCTVKAGSQPFALAPLRCRSQVTASWSISARRCEQSSEELILSIGPSLAVSRGK